VLAPGTAARIFTGALIPPGADCVVMQEQCTALAAVGDAPGLGLVRVDAVPAAGQWLRRRGSDVACDQIVLTRGLRLTPQALGVAAAVGSAPRITIEALPGSDGRLVMPWHCAEALSTDS
jgi:molybdopterin molybdotransferase